MAKKRGVKRRKAMPQRHPGDRSGYGGGDKKPHQRNPARVAEAMGGEVVKSGTITLPPGAIPSPSGGRSSAFDFSQALLQNHPEAVSAYNTVMGGPMVIPKGAPMSDVHDLINRFAGDPEEEASLADKFVSSTYDWCKYFDYTANEEKRVMPHIMAYRHAMRQANKFVLDKEFTVLATQMSSSIKPEKLLTRIPLATLPYEVTWIEFPLRLKVLAMRVAHGLKGVPDGIAPRMGVLLERINDTMATVTMVCEGPECITPNLMGYVYSVDEQTLKFNQTFKGMTPLDAAYRTDRLKNMPMFKDVMSDPDVSNVMRDVGHGSMWGYGMGQGIIHTSAEFAKNIRVPEFLVRHGELAFSRFYDFFEDAGKTHKKFLEKISHLITSEVTEFSGMMRWLVIVLAMLNEVPTRANFIQPMHTMRAGLTRRVAAFDFHRLTLRLPKTKAIPYLDRKLSNVERKHKAHKVRQHWRTYLHSEQHCLPDEHVWEYDVEHGYALCGRCMGFRRRVPEHVRGDPSLGWVHKDYLIKPAKQEFPHDEI
jgi:hypothetical protein